jgi:RNA polymerase sigma factor (sigma-70 family)
VPKYRTDIIAQLARQLSFTPQDTRLAQVNAAEELLHAIDPAKAYPIDFVIFRITGYHPKHVAQDLLTGVALQHDLGLLIELVSDTLHVQAAAVSEPVLSIDDVTERFNVTSKTIQRWRRRGLPARRFLFPDGKRRVGFLVGSVERFFATHREQVQRGTNFSQIDDNERDEILRRARRLATLCHCCQHEISRRIARRLNRSPLTVLHVIRRHDEALPAQAVFASAAQAPSDEKRASIVRAFKHGVSIKRLARRLCRPRSAIYRIIIDDRINRLSKRKMRFIDDPLYHQPEAGAMFSAMLAQQELLSPQRPEDSRVPRDLPPYLAELYRTPLLSPARERALFLMFNFHKWQFVQARRRLEPQFARARDLNEMERHLRDATEVKNAIVQANLRLVVSIARKHLRPSLSLMELVSEGNVTLLRAVEGFDVHKGNRFSTYATFALMKGFARSVPQMLASGRSGGEAHLNELADVRLTSLPDRIAQRDEVRQMLTRLDDRERQVLLAHYGLDESVPATYEQVGERLGISKQRVRQIEQKAIAKLRSSIAPQTLLPQ